jgi:threonine dehydratase
MKTRLPAQQWFQACCDDLIPKSEGAMPASSPLTRGADVHGRVYVPRTTPRQKRDRIAALGASQVEVIVTGDTYDDAAAAALAEATQTGSTLVPAFDDPRTVAGQGTVAVELVDQLGRAPSW